LLLQYVQASSGVHPSCSVGTVDLPQWQSGWGLMLITDLCILF
jgi:hypothetical protein